MRTPARERVLRFDAFTLDLSRCVLLRGDAELPLRPKPFDVLCYLAEHPGRLHSKDELFEAIWPGATVSEDALVKCIGDVREALGDRRGIIKTLTKRGYLLDAEVTEEAAPSPRALSPSPRAAPSAPHALSTRGEGWGEGQRHTPTLELVAAPHPNPLPASGERGLLAAVSRLGVRRRPIALLVAGLALVAAGAGAWALRAPPPLAGNAAHFAIMARAILDNERSAKANREALALLDKALASDPDWVPALLGYTTVMLIDVGEGWVRPPERAARLDQAKAAVERAIKLDPANYLAHQALGDVLRMRGDPDGALAALERALALNPSAPWSHAIIGKVKVDLGRAEEALGDIETALRISPPDHAFYVWYWWAGFAAAHAGKYEATARWLEKAREAKPDYRLPVPLLAVAYAETGREEEGRALMAKYIERAPHLTIETLKRDFPTRNPIVAEQRKRIVAVFRRLGVPEGTLKTGSAR